MKKQAPKKVDSTHNFQPKPEYQTKTCLFPKIQDSLPNKNTFDFQIGILKCKRPTFYGPKWAGSHSAWQGSAALSAQMAPLAEERLQPFRAAPPLPGSVDMPR